MLSIMIVHRYTFIVILMVFLIILWSLSLRPADVSASQMSLTIFCSNTVNPQSAGTQPPSRIMEVIQSENGL